MYLYIKTEREFLVHSKRPLHGRYHYRYYNSKDESPDLWETQPSTWCSARGLFALKTCLERRVCVVPILTQGLVWPNLAIEKEKGELPKGETHIAWSSFLVLPQFLAITLRLGYWPSLWICANPSALFHSGTLVTRRGPACSSPVLPGVSELAVSDPKQGHKHTSWPTELNRHDHNLMKEGKSIKLGLTFSTYCKWVRVSH